jgi:S1-C subfamily serine protease
MVGEEELNMSAKLIEISNALAEVTEAVAARTVAVHTEPRGSSSGVIWRDGIVVTAEHALRRDEDIQLTLPDGRVVAAALVGRDPSTDVAVLRCAELGGAPPEFGDAGTLRPGSLTLVVGRTRASGAVVTVGVASLVAKERRSWTGASFSPYVRLDVNIQPTAVGGAVVDATGRVIGMASGRHARFGVVAVPAALIHAIVETLTQKGRIPQAYLGVGLQPVRVPDAIRQTLGRSEKTAAILLEVQPDGPAGKAGLVIGDILLSLDGRPVARLEDVQSHLASDRIGKKLAAKFLRGGASQDATIVVGERPAGGE